MLRFSRKLFLGTMELFRGSENSNFFFEFLFFDIISSADFRMFCIQLKSTYEQGTGCRLSLREDGPGF